MAVAENIWWSFFDDLTEAIYQYTGFQPNWYSLKYPVFILTLPLSILSDFSIDQLRSKIALLTRSIAEFYKYFLLDNIQLYSNKQLVLVLTIKYKENYFASIPEEVIRIMFTNLEYTAIVNMCKSTRRYSKMCTD